MYSWFRWISLKLKKINLQLTVAEGHFFYCFWQNVDNPQYVYFIGFLFYKTVWLTNYLVFNLDGSKTSEYVFHVVASFCHQRAFTISWQIESPHSGEQEKMLRGNKIHGSRQTTFFYIKYSITSRNLKSLCHVMQVFTVCDFEVWESATVKRKDVYVVRHVVKQ